MDSALPTLPGPAAPSDFKRMSGPLPGCNWVIPGKLLAGAYPASLHDEDTRTMLSTLLEYGVNSFVCLQAELDINVDDQEWRQGRALRCASINRDSARTCLNLTHHSALRVAGGDHSVNMLHMSKPHTCRGADLWSVTVHRMPAAWCLATCRTGRCCITWRATSGSALDVQAVRQRCPAYSHKRASKQLHAHPAAQD